VALHEGELGGRGAPAVSGPSAVTPRKPKGTARACAPPARTRDASPASNSPRSILSVRNPAPTAPERMAAGRGVDDAIRTAQRGDAAALARVDRRFANGQPASAQQVHRASARVEAALR